jgi:hypothetical protein
MKFLVHVNSVLRVREEVMQRYDYNLHQDGWLNAFTDEKSQAMRTDVIPWRGAHERHHIFFSIILAIFTERMMLLWTGSAVKVRIFFSIIITLSFPLFFLH